MSEVLRMSDSGWLAQVSISTPRRYVQGTLQKRRWKEYKSWGMGSNAGNHEMSSSGHAMAVAVMKPQQLWLPTAQDLNKSKPVKSLAQGVWRILTWRFSEKLLAADDFWGRESHFCLGIWLLTGCPCFSGYPTPGLYGKHELHSVGH